MNDIKIQIVGASCTGKTSISHEVADLLREVFRFEVTLIDDGVENPEYPIYNQHAMSTLNKKTKITIQTIQANKDGQN